MRPSVATPSLYAGFALLTCSMLLVQQFLTRVFSIQFNSGLAFLAISTTFLGLGAAGVAVCVLPRAFRAERLPGLVSWLAIAYAVMLVAGFVLEVAVDRAAQAAVAGAEPLTSQIERVITASLFLLPALFLVGLVISLVLRAHAERVGRLYGADLAGGGVGCLLVLPLMQWVGGDDGIFAIGALAAAGAALLAHAHGVRSARAAGAALALLVGCLPFANRERALVDVQSHRTVMGGVHNWVKEDQELARSWNALSRLGFFATVTGREVYVRIDSSCQTSLPSQDPKHTADYVAETDFERLPFVLDRHRRCLEIGAGGGRGMVLAHALGAEQITGVEINPGIVDASLHRFPGFGVGDLVRDVGARLLVGEGRSYVRGTDERFDSLTITFIQTNVASGSAAFALSEANLFTVEAFEDFLGKLAPDGVFHVYRHGGVECLRLVSMLREVFARQRLGNVQDHLYIARNKGNACLVLVGKSPLRAAEVQRLDAAAQDLQLEVVFAPGAGRETRPTNPFPQKIDELRQRGGLRMGEVVALFQQYAHAREFEPIEASYLRAAEPAAFADRCVVDLTAPTDDRPYFFFTGLRHLRDFGLYLDPAGTGILGGTVVMLFWMGAAFALLVALLIVVPLLLRSGARGSARRAGLPVLLYFGGLGVGYIAVQISFIQRFTLFLGHPVYAVAVVLLAFLLSSGAGSACSERLAARGLTVPRLVVLLVAILLAFNWLLPLLFQSGMIAWPVAAKIAVSCALICVLAFPMGMFFPQGIRLVEQAAPEFVPWAWGANSAASVIGSIVALILAIHGGFAVVAVAAAVVYAATTLPAVAMLRRARGGSA